MIGFRRTEPKFIKLRSAIDERFKNTRVKKCRKIARNGQIYIKRQKMRVRIPVKKFFWA